MFYFGAAYYPELWDKEEILKDVKRLKSLGLNCVRVGEFAWSSMEKTEGVYDFSLFKYMLDTMYENGIYTVLCTPSCTPPRWVFKKYPDSLRVKFEGIQKTRTPVYSRAHLCKSHKGIRELNRKIAGEMSKALGAHPGVIGWQIDNELYPYDYSCFCERCVEGFRVWLKDKYKTIEKLNKEWGMYRWSLDYSDFSEIEPPAYKAWENPSRQVEWLRYQNSLINSYAWEQADEIRKYSSAPIGTDMMNPGNMLSYSIMNSKLDVVQHNHYDSEKDLYQSFIFYDMCRTLKDRPFWVTETQPGWNGSVAAYNGYRQGKSCYINSIAPIVKGGEMNLYWHFRSHPTGHELGHGAVYTTAGRESSVAPYIKRASDDISKCAKFLEGSLVKAKIALTYSSTATKNFTFAPMVESIVDDNMKNRLIDTFHDAFRHYNLDVIETDRVLDEYEVILSPMLTTLDENGFKERVIEWVKNGGTWIVGPLSDIMTEYARKFTHAPYSCLEELCGVHTVHQVPIEQDNFKAKWTQGGEFSVALGCDAYECVDSECLATYTGFDLEGLCAIAKRRVGKGTVILLGTAPDKDALLKLVDRKPILDASRNISLTERSGEQNGIIALEIEGKDGYIVLDKEYYDILGERTLSAGMVEIKPYDALFLQEI
ncbi:MAG: beta-galactosidase [Clostridia bacterium]|nr:beta-galactosidase [Clostridia bacterium]